MKAAYLKTIAAIIIFAINAIITNAQKSDTRQLPIDSKVKIGTLDNGMKYYIRKNARPENRVEMRLVVKAGSVLEDENQRGLAHFIEHMCFNGTKNFEKNKLVEYLQSLGIEFGPEINAYTSFDETVYMLTLPADSAKIIETGFQVMEDWAHQVSFDTTEINKERGVIIEEWRINRGAFQRMLDKFLPVLLKGSKYAERLPIGQKEIIETADRETMKRFYDDWYRPDLMAFIIVGDIDVEKTEAKIISQFSNLKSPENPRKRESFEVPPHKEPLAIVASDKESPITIVSVYYKSASPAFKTYDDYRSIVMFSLFSNMLNQRLSELKEKPEPPFINAGSAYGQLIGEVHAFTVSALVSDTGIQKGLQALVEENERISRYGFTESELERTKKIILNQYEKSYNEREKSESSAYISEYTRNFLNGEPIPGIEFEYELVKNILPGIKLDEINTLSKKLITRENSVIVVQSPEKEGINIPNENQLLAIAQQAENLKLEPYEDKQTGTELLAETPEKGRILFTKKRTDIGITEYKLSNGAKVILKNTDFKNDEILFTAESFGGQSLVPDSSHMSALHAASIMNESGLGEFSKTDLQKLLAGKTVTLSGSIGMYSENLSGQSSPKDLETLMQLIYLKFTSPRKDQNAFNSYISKIKAYYSNVLSDPSQYFSDCYRKIKTQGHPRVGHIPSDKDIEEINLDKAYDIYKERFTDASGFNFYFVGAINPDSVKPLIETYIASLPSSKQNESWKDLGIRAPKGKTDTAIFKGADSKSLVIISFEKERVWNEKDDFLFTVFGQILERKYIEILREEMSGVYNVSASAGLDRIPYERASLDIYFPCSPGNTDSLTNAVLKEVQKIQTEGISAEDIAASKEIERRSIEESLKTNGFWLSKLQGIYRYNLSPGVLVNINEVLENITPEEIQRIANDFDTNIYLRAVLYPESLLSK
ncbi:MAG: insulinase family protein [Bacteroidales bacterium]|nr:insulinase family protein [Bacteroidales bacterium]